MENPTYILKATESSNRMHARTNTHTHASTCRPLLTEPHASTHSLTHPHPPLPLTLHLPPPIPTCNTSVSEWGIHPISSEFWTVGSQSTNKYCREEIHCTTVLHHCITPHQHCIKSPTRCTTLPMMHTPLHIGDSTNLT